LPGGEVVAGEVLENGKRIMASVLLGSLILETCLCQTFQITGYEELTGPGSAHLMLLSSAIEDLENETLRVEISGPMAGVLIYDEVAGETDLGYFQLEEGNYTFDIYVLETAGATLEESGTALAQGQVTFEIPSPPELPEPDAPLVDPVNLGFMITALFIFGLVLAIWRTGSKGGTPQNQEP
jgi:hypothetical protein